MTSCKPPIFIIEGHDVDVYSSISEARLDLEAIDVQEGVYTGYDSEGRLLDLRAMLGEIDIRPAEEAPLHADDLEKALRHYLKAVGEAGIADAQNQLDELVRACEKLARQ